jgi:hypothetical protein
MLYAVGEIAIFMIGATIIGFLLGRYTKRSAPHLADGGDTAELADAQAAIRELESERADLRGQLADSKERVRQLAAEPTASESSAAAQELQSRNEALEQALEEAEARTERLLETIARRDSRIAELTSEEPPQEERPAAPIGYSSSAGTLADMRIVFDEDEKT